MSDPEGAHDERDLYTDERVSAYLERRHLEFPWLYIEEPHLRSVLERSYDGHGNIVVVGPGPGTTDLRAVIEHGVPQECVWAVEPNPRFAEILQETFPGVTVVNRRLQDAELPEGRFNLAVASMVYQHLGPVALRRSLSTLHDALEPKGRLLSMMINHEWLGHLALQRGLGELPVDEWVHVPYTWSNGVALRYRNWAVDSVAKEHSQAGLAVGYVAYLAVTEEGRLASPQDYKHGMHPYRARAALFARRADSPQ